MFLLHEQIFYRDNVLMNHNILEDYIVKRKRTHNQSLWECDEVSYKIISCGSFILINLFIKRFVSMGFYSIACQFANCKTGEQCE